MYTNRILKNSFNNQSVIVTTGKGRISYINPFNIDFNESLIMDYDKFSFYSEVEIALLKNKNDIFLRKLFLNFIDIYKNVIDDNLLKINEIFKEIKYLPIMIANNYKEITKRNIDNFTYEIERYIYFLYSISSKYNFSIDNSFI